MIATLNNYVHQLAYFRKVEANALETIAGIEAELVSTPLSQRLGRAKEFLGAARLDKANAADRVRNAALAEYQVMGNKQPHPAVKVVLATVLDYDPADALTYCREHLPKALKLDKRTFERAAKAIEPGFVTIEQEPRTRIAKDLSAHLDEAGGTATNAESTEGGS